MLRDKIPNSLKYVTFVSVEEMLGKNGLHAILNLGGLRKYRENYPANNENLEIPFDDFNKIIAAFIDIFGEHGAKSILYNSGHKAF